MSRTRSVVVHGKDRGETRPLVEWLREEMGLRVSRIVDTEGVLNALNTTFPACVVLDGFDPDRRDEVLDLCRKIKKDPFTGIVPVVILAPQGSTLPADGLDAGADEVVTDAISSRERRLRVELLLRRAARDVNVHPTTRLPGTAQIERDIAERLARGGLFAVCYADLDHFKEFNDRYGYNNGDRVILMLSRILRDIVRGLSTEGFVGHIGGDDFIFTVPAEDFEVCCREILHLFDELSPYQYTEEDRKTGYFMGKDRRGAVHRVPVMTLSIGVVTNEFHTFTHTGQVSELAAEMKTYAKTLPGSVFVVDRRESSLPGTEAGEEAEAGPTSKPATRRSSEAAVESASEPAKANE